MRYGAALLLIASACLQVPDYEGKSCSIDTPCPAGLFCGADLRCRATLEPEAMDAAALLPDRAEAADAGEDPAPGQDAGTTDGAETAADAAAAADAAPTAPDATSIDAADAGPPDTGDPRAARCAEPQASLTVGWQARHFQLDTRNAFTTCVGVEEIPGDDIDRDYGVSGPYPTLTDRFGTRYTARRMFRNGVYTFQINHDDGLRIYVDGDLVYERWDAGMRTGVVARTRYLSEGPHDIVIEHFDDTGPASLSVHRVLGCTPLIAPTTGWNLYYFRLGPGNVIDQTVCYGAENLRTDFVALDWGTGAPRPVQVAGLVDNFAAIGVTSRRLQGMTRFTMSHDDGMRLRVGNRVLYDGWTGPANATATTYVTGDNVVLWEMFDVVANASVSLTWAKVCDGPQTNAADSWFAAYYRVVQNAAGGFELDKNDCLGAETVPGIVLEQDFMGSAPAQLASQMIVERFGAEYFATRTFAAATPATTFHDDGMRVSAGTTLLYDRWIAPNVSGGSLTIPAGTQRLKVEYFENQGGAQVHLRW